MNTFKQRLALLLFIALFTSANTAVAETADADTAKVEHHAQHNLDLTNVYHGFLPCADCKGVKTSIAFNKKGTYILLTQYVGKSDREIVEKGKFAWGNQVDTIVLTPRNSTQIRQYAVEEGRLIQLDDNGSIMTGENADRYVLRSAVITKEPGASSHH